MYRTQLQLVHLKNMSEGKLSSSLYWLGVGVCLGMVECSGVVMYSQVCMIVCIHQTTFIQIPKC